MPGKCQIAKEGFNMLVMFLVASLYKFIGLHVFGKRFFLIFFSIYRYFLAWPCSNQALQREPWA